MFLFLKVDRHLILKRTPPGKCSHLMVPVGEGMGLTKLRRSGSGMWIFSGEICGYSGRSGDAGASSAWNRAVNWIFMAVLGNRKVHLQRGGEGVRQAVERSGWGFWGNALAPLENHDPCHWAFS